MADNLPFYSTTDPRTDHGSDTTSSLYERPVEAVDREGDGTRGEEVPITASNGAPTVSNCRWVG